MATPNTVTKLPPETTKHLFSFLQKATPAEIEALLSSAHAYLQAGLVQSGLDRTRQILARDGS
jgi:hypothetical protein